MLYLRLLRNRYFLIYWTGSTIVQLGLQFSTIALTWFVLQTTGSAAQIGLVLAVVPISRMATSPFIGCFIDKLPRRALMMLDNLCQGVLYVLIPVLYGLHVLSFPLLLVIVALAGALSPLSMIGRGVILPNIVSSDDLEMANGFSQLCISFVTLFGPALGGVLVGLLGAQITLAITSACYALYVLSLLLIPAPRYAASNYQDDTTGSEPQLNGWKYLYRIPLLLLLVIVTLFFNLTYGPLGAPGVGLPCVPCRGLNIGGDMEQLRRWVTAWDTGVDLVAPELVAAGNHLRDHILLGGCSAAASGCPYTHGRPWS
nr:MFS transporter [Alicyclobacillus kakegawensis]